MISFPIKNILIFSLFGDFNHNYYAFMEFNRVNGLLIGFLKPRCTKFFVDLKK